MLLFASTVWGYLQSFPSTLLGALFFLHSFCLILLAYLYSMERNDYTGMEELQQELAVLRSQSETEKVTLERAVEASEKELANSREELQHLRETLSQREQRVDELTDRVTNAKAKIDEMQTDINDFLPPVDEAPVLTDIIKLARESAEELDSCARKSGVNIRISAAQESLYVKVQPVRIRIMFRNIIDNSIKYMNRAGSLVITISAIEDDIFIVLKDTGEGLAEDETKHIVELNFQGSNRISGNGLGLTQAKAIVDYYGGTIYGKSSPGKGMGIYIQLPMTKTGEKAAEASGEASAPASEEVSE